MIKVIYSNNGDNLLLLYQLLIDILLSVSTSEQDTPKEEKNE